MKQDHRNIDEQTRFHIRQRAMMMISKGEKKGKVAELFGVNPTTISQWVKKHALGGKTALKCKKKGPKSEDMKLLSSEQEKQIRKMLIDKYPDQYKLPFALWTRKAVKELIEQQFGVVLAIRTVGEYLKRWNFTPQKPAKRAYEQCDKKVQKWLDEEYPTIKERAKNEDVEIYWGDETGSRNYTNCTRGYAQKGETPVKVGMAKKFSVNIISAITNQGQMQFMYYSETMNADRLIEFMERLIKGAKRKIFLILDNLKVHHCFVVKDWLKENNEKIELFYLPSYSPELNPDEYLNCDLKRELSEKPSPKNKEQLAKNVISHLEILQKSPEKIQNFFKHNKIKYAS